MNSLLICPEYFDGRLNGIGRVSEAVSEALSMPASLTEVWSANEAKRAAEFGFGHAFGRNYPRMIVAALSSSAQEVRLVGSMHLGLSPVARLLAWRRRCPYFVFIHGVEAWMPIRPRSRWGLKGVSVLLFNSRHTLLRFGKISPSLANLPSKVVELGVSAPEW